MAPTKLESIADIFQRRIFRIPDYQRGYAWNNKQLEDFWEDLDNLSEEKFHYTGVLTLEEVSKEIYERWDDDKWIIDKGYRPYFVVDGQQRLLTIIILIEVILEKLGDSEDLNYSSKSEIREKYIFNEYSREKILSSYIFGYAKDNPSYEFLKSKIFCEYSSTNRNIETLYTKNLENSKNFFLKKIKDQSKEKIEIIFKKITQQFKFNLYEIDNELDVFVAFETMNNRGKSLSKLELLKNRLIYLSTLLSNSDYEKDELRKCINESWKTIYEYLGKNKDNPLEDDEFLENHWILYFKYTRETGNAFSKFLLEQEFTAKKVSTNNIKAKDIENYIRSLQSTVKIWYRMFNPEELLVSNEVKKWVSKLNRLGFSSFAPLLMATLSKNESEDSVIKLIKVMEKFNFLIFKISRRKSDTGNSTFYKFARELYTNEIQIEDIIESIDNEVKKFISIDRFKDYIRENFIIREKDGYYGWNGLRYFLFEYEESLRENSLDKIEKIDWKEFNEYKKDYISIEHIYPQTPGDNWGGDLDALLPDEKNKFCNTLGNLVGLSRRKNSHLQNLTFQEKKKKWNKENTAEIGYFNGSHSEIEISQIGDWTTEEIIKRGLKLLEFMELRWSINIENKQDLLFLEGF